MKYHLIEEFDGKVLSCRLLVKADTVEAAVKKIRRMKQRRLKRISTTYRPATEQETLNVVGNTNAGGASIKERLDAILKRK